MYFLSVYNKASEDQLEKNPNFQNYLYALDTLSGAFSQLNHNNEVHPTHKAPIFAANAARKDPFFRRNNLETLLIEPYMNGFYRIRRTNQWVAEANNDAHPAFETNIVGQIFLKNTIKIISSEAVCPRLPSTLYTRVVIVILKMYNPYCDGI